MGRQKKEEAIRSPKKYINLGTFIKKCVKESKFRVEKQTNKQIPILFSLAFSFPLGIDYPVSVYVFQ